MVKKFKIKDLEDDPNLPLEKSESDSRTIKTITDIDMLPDEAEIVKSKPVVEIPSLPVNSNTQKEKPVYFERNIVVSYFSKGLSVSVALLSFELISHFIKYFNEIDVFNRENYHSYFFSGNSNWVLCKVVAVFIFVYFITNKESIVMNKKGIQCIDSEIGDFLLFKQENVFITWDQISRLELKIRLFEPYLYFYDSKENQLGHVEFSIKDKDKFFTFIEKNAGKDHPICKLKDSPLLF